MAGSVNKVILIGSESWRDKQSGERKEKTEWHRVVIFNENIAKVAEQYLKKGSTVYIEGQLQTRKYEQNGVEKYTTEVVLQKYRGELTMLGGKGDGGGKSYDDEGGGSFSSKAGAKRVSDGPRESFTQDLDDEIPF